MRKVRDIASIIVALILIGLIPIYGEPFSGCSLSGYSTWVLGCSAWPKFLTGFIFLGSLVVLAFHKKALATVGLVIVFAVVLAGGIGLLGTGEELIYFKANYADIVHHASSPLLHGALTAFCLFFVTSRVLNGKQNNVRSA